MLILLLVNFFEGPPLLAASAHQHVLRGLLRPQRLLRLAALLGTCGPLGLGEAILGGSPFCGPRRDDLDAYLITMTCKVIQRSGYSRSVNGLVNRLLGGPPLLLLVVVHRCVVADPSLKT